MPQIRLANITGKTIKHFFAPADGKAVTFVLEEGRMSLGAPMVRLSDSLPSQEGAKITGSSVAAVDDAVSALTLVTDRGQIVVTFAGAPALTELPE